VPDDLVVYADASLLRRVFQNLIANAIKYTRRGEIVVGAKDLPADGVVECWVTDNGTGIPATLRETIFDLDKAKAEDSGNDGGTGLGLAIVKTFAEAHGGEVSVESTEGVGSTFRFSLPTREKATGVADR
jgi:signal transduction histidine kinase